jgi:hypothetical protein
MDAIVDELKAMGGLQFPEKKLLSEGKTSECLAAVCQRTRKWHLATLWLFLSMLTIPVLIGLAALVFQGRGAGSNLPWQLGVFPALTIIPQLLWTSHRLARLETLALLWRMTNAGEKSVGRAA